MATDEERQAAKARLTALSAKYRKQQALFQGATDDLHAAIVDVLKARTLRPGEVNDLVPFNPGHVNRIARAGGVEPLRPATVVSKRRVEEG